MSSADGFCGWQLQIINENNKAVIILDRMSNIFWYLKVSINWFFQKSFFPTNVLLKSYI
jgi:hypothetical protein